MWHLQSGAGPNRGLLSVCKTSFNLRDCSFEALAATLLEMEGVIASFLSNQGQYLSRCCCSQGPSKMFCLLSNFLVVIFYVDTDITRVLVSSISMKFAVCNVLKKFCATSPRKSVLQYLSLDVRIITDTGYRYEAAHLQTLSYLNVLPGQSGHLTSVHLL